MTPFLLDTNVLSEAKKPRPDPQFMRWWSDLDKTCLFISVITIGEIHRGAIKLMSSNPERAKLIQRWLSEIESSGPTRILGIDRDIACRCAEMQIAYLQRGVADLLIRFALAPFPGVW